MQGLKFGSVCSGIEAASVAWGPLGWKPQFVSEIEPFPCALLKHHYPDVPNHGDMTKFKDWPDATLDVLAGGTPCQSFSVAGLRGGLDDPRGNLMLTFGAVAARYRPRWLVWENVPGVLSSNGGRDFGAFLGLLGFLGYGFAYRVLDAQYIRVDSHARAVPQRRNRVFVVGCLGDWRSAAAVLLERESLRGDPAPRRSSGARVAATLTRGAESSGKGGYAGRRQEDYVNIVAATLDASYGRLQGASGQDLNHGHSHLLAYGGNNTRGPIEVATACRAKGGSGHGDFESETFIAHTLRGEGFDARDDGTGRGTPLVPHVVGADCYNGSLTGDVACTMGTPGSSVNASGPTVMVPIAFHPTQDPISSTDGSTHALGCGSPGGQASVAVALAVALRGREGGATAELGDEVQNCLRASSGGGDKPHVLHAMQVRRLTPVECERLQGFPDNYTLVPWRGKLASDGVRYKAIGNSWATNCAQWIGRRIQMVEAIKAKAPTR